KNYMQVNNIEMEDADMSSALVAITPEAASIPTPRLKNVSRLRTEHQVYELPDSHPLLEGYDQREPDDPCPYLLSIWTPGETAQSIDAPKTACNSNESGKLCDSSACFSCNSMREAQAQTVRGTILVPCRTAMRGSFPLNGTYFQVNEVYLLITTQAETQLMCRGDGYGTSLGEQFTSELQFLQSLKV
uniref:Uncharacterized protein n=1 Tax=Aegilops tauschii subsp. strangulata TaxID=200361 RepID=A0A453KIP0_AEGTS